VKLASLATLMRHAPPLALALLLVGSCGRPSSRFQDPADSGDLQVAEPEVAELVPMVATPADQLSNDVLEHTELLRLSRDFGKREFEVALDAWVDRRRPGELALVRLWWSRVDRDLERSPFGSRSRRHFEIDDDRVTPAHWRVHLLADRKVFSFDVRIDDGDAPAAYATVRSSDGQRVEHCRVQRGELQARRVVGVPAGIDGIAVVCTDSEGATHEGHVAWTPDQR
jgi:hypothetical protein